MKQTNTKGSKKN